MKKFALMLAVAMPVLAMTSCGDDEVTDVTLDQNTMSVNYQAEGQLKASENGGTWASANEFVATVDNKGKVQGVHCGVTTITYSKDGSSASCQVTVTPTNTNFTLPILTWGATKATVNANLPANLFFLQDDTDGNMYTEQYASTIAGAKPWYTYNYTNNALDGAGLFTATDNDPWDFLKQYFAKKETTDKGVIIMYDADSATAATTQVQYSLNVEKDWVQSLFVPVTHTKAANDEAINHMLKLVNRK